MAIASSQIASAATVARLNARIEQTAVGESESREDKHHDERRDRTAKQMVGLGCPVAAIAQPFDEEKTKREDETGRAPAQHHQKLGRGMSEACPPCGRLK